MDRPKVIGFKNHDKLTELQQTILRLFTTALIGDTEVRDTESVKINFTKHSAKGGWVTWLTAKDKSEMPTVLKKISYARRVVEIEKKSSGLCRVFLIPVTNEKNGWQGFKIRLDRGDRQVHENL
jgi:hypothetical protein